jgi:hypothetical protein
MSSLLFAVSVATASPLVPTWTEPHTWKVEVYSHSPATNPYSSDWRQTEMEVYAATLVCAPTRPRTEECTFADRQVYWGYRLSGQTDVVIHALPQPASLEITWTDRGRMAHYDWIGNREPLWSAQCTAYLELDHEFDGQNRQCKPDFMRIVGGRLDESLALDLVGALEVELPKNGDSGGKPWVVSQPPFAGRRYLSTGIASSEAKWTDAGDTPEGRRLELSGTVTERPVNAGSVSADFATETSLTEIAIVDAAGRPVTLEAHAVAKSTSTLYGFIQTDSYSTRLPTGSPGTPPSPDPVRPP